MKMKLLYMLIFTTAIISVMQPKGRMKLNHSNRGYLECKKSPQVGSTGQ